MLLPGAKMDDFFRCDVLFMNQMMSDISLSVKRELYLCYLSDYLRHIVIKNVPKELLFFSTPTVQVS